MNALHTNQESGYILRSDPTISLALGAMSLREKVIWQDHLMAAKLLLEADIQAVSDAVIGDWKSL